MTHGLWSDCLPSTQALPHYFSLSFYPQTWSSEPAAKQGCLLRLNLRTQSLHSHLYLHCRGRPNALSSRREGMLRAAGLDGVGAGAGGSKGSKAANAAATQELKVCVGRGGVGGRAVGRLSNRGSRLRGKECFWPVLPIQVWRGGGLLSSVLSQFLEGGEQPRN